MTTFHALQRTRERTGFNAKTSQRFIASAIKRGKSAETFTAKERAYLQRQEARQGCWTVVYDGYCFIIGNDGYCVTMYRLPQWFGKIQYDGKQKIRDAKKYMRFYDYYEQEELDYGLSEVS